MRVSSKGPVTNPHGRIRKTKESARGRLALEALRGTAEARMSTDEIVALTRGKVRPRKRRK